MSVRKEPKRVDHSGSTFNSFLEQEGMREQVEAVAMTQNKGDRFLQLP